MTVSRRVSSAAATMLLLCLLCSAIGFLPVSNAYHYQTKTFQVPVDHFSFANNDTFTISYLINDTFWRKSEGPIFFYTGNEGSIELFCENTGLIWDLAPEYKALVVFAEHRYYGNSLPYGNKSFSSPKYSGYLTSQQALADYADLIIGLKQTLGAKKSPVIAFGGSYGGMLSAYFRMKYPHIVQGAIAASAPIWQFTGLADCNVFGRIATSAYKFESENCPDVIRKSWTAINTISASEEGLKWLNSNWKLCKPLTTSNAAVLIKSWLTDMYGNLAMANYPYPASFLGDLPAFPVRAFCSRLKPAATKTPQELLSTLFDGISVYFNYTGSAKCLDAEQGAPGLDAAGWNYQSCTEMVMPMCTDGVNDMFEPEAWDFKKIDTECNKLFNVRPDPYLAEKIYGGKNIGAASNIIFSNGLLDPWSGGGVLKTLSKTLIAVLIPEGAHHLDLRASQPDDPDSVVKARSMYRQFISYWISNYKFNST